MTRARSSKTPSRAISWSTIERPGDVGMELPAGASAGSLSPIDYHPVDMEATHPLEHAPARPPARVRSNPRGTRGK